MDAAELKIVCDNYEKRLAAMQVALDRTNQDTANAWADRICANHGGHEYIDSAPPLGAIYKICKHCGQRKQDY